MSVHPAKGTIWIDLDNSPHVPFFAPIIDELQNYGYATVLTARDCFQVRELADLFHLDYTLVGPGEVEEVVEHRRAHAERGSEGQNHGSDQQ